MTIFLTFIVWFLTGVMCGYFAFQRGRNPYVWFGLGLFFGLLGLAALFLMPALNQEGDEELEEKDPLDDQVPAVVSEVDPSTREWFCVDKQKAQQGPMSFDALKTLWSQGIIDSTSYVWCDGMEKWEKIENMSWDLTKDSDN